MHANASNQRFRTRAEWEKYSRPLEAEIAQYLDQSGITAHIPEHNEQYLRETPETETCSQSGFTYDEDEDEYI